MSDRLQLGERPARPGADFEACLLSGLQATRACKGNHGAVIRAQGWPGKEGASAKGGKPFCKGCS